MDLQTAARQYLGCKWHHLGRTRAGVDCLGLAILAARDAGRSLEDRKNYPREANGKELIAECDRQLNKADKNKLKPNDFILMRMGKQQQHVGIITDIGLIHAHQKAGEVIEHNLDDKWRKRIIRAYTL